jgi:hypothetical protein
MNTYTVTFWLDDEPGTETVEAESRAHACADVQDRYPNADVWGARPERVVHQTQGQTPSDEVMAKIAEEIATPHRWLVTITQNRTHMSGSIRHVTPEEIEVVWYDRVHRFPWPAVSAVALEACF